MVVIGILLLINFSFSDDTKIQDKYSTSKVIAITSGAVTLILTGCLGVGMYKMYQQKQVIDANKKQIKKMKDTKNADNVELDRLQQWYNFHTGQNTYLSNTNAKLQEVINEVAQKHKNDTDKACAVVNSRWASKKTSTSK